jgi:Protein of unknown function (DUF806).
MTAVMEMYHLLKDAELPGIDHIYPNMIPTAAQAQTDATDVLVTEFTEAYTDFGSNQATVKDETLALNIFYALATDNDFTETEETLVSFCIPKIGTSHTPPHTRSTQTHGKQQKSCTLHTKKGDFNIWLQ